MDEKEDLRSLLGENLFKVDGKVTAAIQLLVTDGDCGGCAIVGSQIELLQTLVNGMKQSQPLRELLRMAVMISEGPMLSRGFPGMPGLPGMMGGDMGNN